MVTKLDKWQDPRYRSIWNALVNAHMTYSVERMDGCLMLENLLLEDVVDVVFRATSQTPE